MRVIDQTLMGAATARPRWQVLREGFLVFKRPVAFVTRHPPLVGELRAEGSHFVGWLRVRAAMPGGITGGDFYNIGTGLQVGKGPVRFINLEEAFSTVEAWVDDNCRMRRCGHVEDEA